VLLFFLSICFFSASFFASSQGQFPDYHPPLDIPLLVAGNFGELRSSHFHTGIDFKTQQREGLPIYAIEQGYVARVKVSSFGYGKVVYINHPNGKTSVYAHCSKFLGELGKRIQEEQYRAERFEVELFFVANELPIKKGQKIALSGNTGGSTAPHLHFELRDTKTETAQNPLLYAFDLPDKQKPKLTSLSIVSVNQHGYMIPNKVIEIPLSSNKKEGDTVQIPASFCSSSGGIGLAVDMVDFLDGSPNKCGVYGSWLIVDGDTLFGHQINEISFDQMNCVHTHRLGRTGNSHKLFRNQDNLLPFYFGNRLGVIPIAPGESKKIHIVAYDPKGNNSSISFTLQAKEGEFAKNYRPSKERFWYPAYGYSRKNNQWEISADAYSIFEPQEIDMKKTPHICQLGTPLNKRITVRIKLENPTLPVEKYYIAVQTKNRKYALATTYKNGWLETKTNMAGELSILSDEIPPEIKLLTKKKDKIVRLLVIDRESSLYKYDLYVDNKWHLLEYEYKNNSVFFEVDPQWKGAKNIQIIASDRCGNKATWEQKMTF